MIRCDKNRGGLLRKCVVIRFREGYCSTSEFKKKKKTLQFNVSIFRSIFIINFGKVRGSTLYRRFPFLIFDNSKGFQMMYR